MNKNLMDSLLGTLKHACILCGALAGGCLIGFIVGTVLGVLYVAIGPTVFWVLGAVALVVILIYAWYLHHSKE